MSFKRSHLVVVVGLATMSPWFAAAQEAGTVTAIVGGYLIDGNEGPPIRDAIVLVEGDRITHVGTVSDTDIPSGARIISAEGRTVMPGLHEAHAHLFIVGHGEYGDYFTRYHYQRDRMRELMQVSARELLMAGVTSARDVGAELEDALWIRDAIADGRVVGPRLFVSGPFLQKNTGPTQEFFRITVDGAEDARRQARGLIDAGVDLIKVIELGRLSPAERAAIAEEARKAGLHIAVHAYSVDEIRAAAEMGARTIEHVGGGPGPRYPDESIRIMAENNIFLVPTAMVSLVYDVTDDFPERLDDPRLRQDLPADVYSDVRQSLEFRSRLGYFRTKRERSPTFGDKIRQAYDSGVRLLVGTDSGTPMNFHYESTWQEMDWFVRFGIPPMKVISMATRYPALAYGIYDQQGTIEPGKLADIIIVDGNPLQDMSALRESNVEWVMKGGVVFKGPHQGRMISGPGQER
ncbi:MAG TPA: amidohydrolase family protein [Longimicrobiales bacterium]|nr:amidohydrolase family protein [Longimicrobiales bacterium]